jgi:hypothetical protein
VPRRVHAQRLNHSAQVACDAHGAPIGLAMQLEVAPALILRSKVAEDPTALVSQNG